MRSDLKRFEGRHFSEASSFLSVGVHHTFCCVKMHVTLATGTGDVNPTAQQPRRQSPLYWNLLDLQ
jgi:hypothetical protein